MRILHLLHSDAIGGVEAAAAHLQRAMAVPSAPADELPDDAAQDGAASSYRLGTLGTEAPGATAFAADVTGRGLNDPRSVLALLRDALSSAPDVLVTSLWRAVLVGTLVKLLRPRQRWAVWVHLPRYTHALDRLVHRWALPRADTVLCDSTATRDAVLHGELARRVAAERVSIVQPHALPVPVQRESADFGAPAAEAPLRLVYWGRVVSTKRVDLAIELVKELRRIRPGGAELLVIGPDIGEQAGLQELVGRLGLEDAVHFAGPADREHLAELITGCNVFVSLSDVEGFAMSSHEALALGLVCVLTPVGQLAADTTDGVDSLHHHGELAATAARLTALAQDPAAWDTLRHAAAGTGQDTFVDEFVKAVRAVGAAPGRRISGTADGRRS